MMWRLLLASALRFHLRQPWQLGLALIGIALGVAAFIGIQSANSAAERAFALSSGAFVGSTSHQVLPVGGDLPVDVYEDLVLAGFGNSAAPVLSVAAGLVASSQTPRSFELIGIDPIEELRLRRFFATGPDPVQTVLRLMREPGALLAEPGSLPPSAIGADGSVRLEVAGRVFDFHLIGDLSTTGADVSATPPLITDIKGLQNMLGERRLTRIDLAIAGSTLTELEQQLPPGTALVATDSQNSELGAMTSAFTTNLTALGLLALVVGLFLIHATMSFTVVRRRAQIATLRALGLTRPELIVSIGLEAIAIGATAGLAGAMLGQALATGLVDLVLRTMNDLAFSRAIGLHASSAWTYPAGVGLGVASTLIAGILPAWEAASVAPADAQRRSDLERRASKSSGRFAAASIPALFGATAILVLWPRSLPLAFFAMFIVLGAGAVCVPMATILLMRLLDTPVRVLLGVPGVMAVRSVSASLSRTGVTTAALAIAVATVISIGLMVGSFRVSLIEWIDDTLTADLYLMFPSAPVSQAPLERWAKAITLLPEVAGISRTRRVSVYGPLGEVGVRAATPGPEGWGLDLLPGHNPDWGERLGDGSGVVVTEPYAYRHRLAAGDTLTLRAATGDAFFDIVGIAREYNTAGSAVTMSLAAYRRQWGDTAVSGLGVHLVPGSAPSSVTREIEALRPAGIASMTRSTAGIRDISLRLFDRTFEITGVLRALAGLVAFFGVLSAMLALQLERRTEFSVLHSIGMSSGQLRIHVIAQTLLLGLAAGLTAIPIGSVLAWLLVFVINKRAFGWSMDFILAPGPIGYGFAVAMGAAGLAGVAAALVGISTRSRQVGHGS